MSVASHKFEPEWDGLPPREIPDELRHGPLSRSRRNVRIGTLTSGAICLGCSALPLFDKWGQFFLPFAYLNWIGAGLLVLGVGLALFHYAVKGRFAYVESGTPLVGRILELSLAASQRHNGVDNAYRYHALVEVEHPDSGEPFQFNAASDEIGAAFKEQYELSFRVGDQATVVYFPNRFEKTVRLYGFLNLRTGLGLIKAGETAEKPSTPFKTVAIITLIAGCFFSMCWSLYAFGRYMPVEHHWSEFAVAGVGALTIGLVMFFWILRDERRAREKVEAQNARAYAEGKAVQYLPPKGFFARRILPVIFCFGALMLGGVVSLCWAWTFNAWLDRSPPRIRPIEILDQKHTTHHGIIRIYELTFRFLDDPAGEKHECASSPQEMEAFLIPLGNADIRAGAFGWPWVNSLEPLPGPGKP